MSLTETLKSLNKKFGDNTVITGGKINIETVSTGCYSLDKVFGTGMPKGRIIEMYGAESCLHPDTFINYEIRKGSRRQNSKGGTIERLYERFNKIKKGGLGNYQHKATLNSQFFVSSINENNRVIKQRVLDVVKCGVKKCFRVKTNSSQELICTGDHKFYIGNGKFAPLNDLHVGSTIYIHNNTHYKGRQIEQIRHEEVYVKYHPTEYIKLIDKKYKYCRLKKCKAIMEASLSGLSYQEYIDLLNSGDKTKIKKQIKLIPKGFDIHHIDHNPSNNDLSNLKLLKKSDHYRYHALKSDDKLRFIVVKTEINSIEYYGDTETYDIKCPSPYNNYIANGIVVHNSGKSTMALYLIAQMQKMGGNALLIDTEFAYDRSYASKIGVNTDKLLLAQPTTGEEAGKILIDTLRTGDLSIIVIDSVAALAPEKEITGEIDDQQIALQARMIGKMLRMTVAEISHTKTFVIFVNQLRDKVGMFVGVGTTTPGGRALKFYSSVRLEVKAIKKIKDKDQVIGNRLKITATKNKVGLPFRSTELDLYFEKGIDVVGDIFDRAVERNVIEKSGNTYIYKSEKLGVGRDQVKSFLEEDTNKKIFSDIKNELINLKTI